MSHETITGNFVDQYGLNGFIKCDPNTGILQIGNPTTSQPISVSKEFVQFHLMPMMAYFVTNGRLPDPDYSDNEETEVTDD